MLKKRQRLTNLNHTRAEIAGQLQQLTCHTEYRRAQLPRFDF